MKSKLLTIAVIFLLAACTQQKGINLMNSSKTDVVRKSVELKRSEIEQRTGSLPEAEVAYLIDKDGNKLSAQLDDIDMDGKWDVLFTQVDLKSGETKSYTISFDNVMVESKTNIRFADKNDATLEFKTADRLTSNTTEISQQYFQFEGPGWENDVVAFRNYFDARNGIDIFGKITTDMALDQCGLKDGPTYHELQPWGMDILKVANSLGAGAIAIETASGLYRVGADSKGTYALVKEGPLRSIFDLDFEGMQIDGKTVNIKHRISIEAGKPYYKSQVWVEGIEDSKLVTGIVNLHSDSVYSKVNTDAYSYFFTHDNQAFDGEKLGMAILVDDNTLTAQTAPEEGEGITQTFYTALPISSQPVEFYFMVGWEKQDAIYSTIEGFENEIKTQSQNLACEVDIR